MARARSVFPNWMYCLELKDLLPLKKKKKKKNLLRLKFKIKAFGNEPLFPRMSSLLIYLKKKKNSKHFYK